MGHSPQRFGWLFVGMAFLGGCSPLQSPQGVPEPEIHQQHRASLAEPLPISWSVTAIKLIQQQSRLTASSLRSARAGAIVHLAMRDAAIAAHHSHLGNQPSVDAAISYAAAEALGYLIPEKRSDLLAKADASSKRDDNSTKDIEAGKGIGKAAAQAIIKRAITDGADKEYPPYVSQGTGLGWRPNAGKKAKEPYAGAWKTWGIPSGSHFRIPREKVMAIDFASQLPALFDIQQALTPKQIESAHYWDKGDASEYWCTRAHQLLRDNRVGTIESAKILGGLSSTIADSLIAAWDTKYAYLVPRPDQLSIKVGRPFVPIVTTPSHPSYPSGHATASRAAAVYLGAYFPSERKSLLETSDAGAFSRLYLGIHFPSDSEDGKALGQAVAEYILNKER